MKKFAALLIVLMMLTGFMTATAEMVFATGNLFLRQGPGENYSAIATVYSGSSMQYAGQTTYDANGVAIKRGSRLSPTSRLPFHSSIGTMLAMMTAATSGKTAMMPKMISNLSNLLSASCFC